MEYGISTPEISCCFETMAATESFKSWAQQTEESYQLQLALALRLSSQAALATDSNFLDTDPNPNQPSASPESVSNRFWVNGCLSYNDRVPDGFYSIQGVDPYAWSLSTDQQDIGHLPSLDLLRAVDPRADSLIKVVLIDRSKDVALKELQSMVGSLSCSWINNEGAAFQLANMVCKRLGGVVSNEKEGFEKCWEEYSDDLERQLGSIVLPIGVLPVGLCVHRALLFKVLADSINLPCRIAKGCKYCRRSAASSCIVRIGDEREYWIDLFGKPGALSKPDSSLNCASSILVSSPLYHPRLKSIQAEENFRSLAKVYFLDFESLDLSFDSAPSATTTTTTGQDDKISSSTDKKLVGASSNWIKDLDVIISKPLVKGSVASSLVPPAPRGHRNMHHVSVLANPNHNAPNHLPFMEIHESIRSSSSELHLEEEDLDIPWSELKLKGKIGAGSFGTVHHADWRGSDVAVKILMEQEFHAERFQEFLREVAIMKRLRHPNIVLFMGAVTQPPQLSIVTEYLSRGSLYKLLHMPGSEWLDVKLRLNMAYDVAKGMNYLHQLRPPIVHRDLKSPNLLVDSAYTVKVCDFGLSRSKANTYLSSKTAAGTPEWMAPEVLRNESSNEKSDIYSFGVILWELVTLQQPWKSLNQAQVVGAVGFKGQRLEIPSNVHPLLAALIDSCLAHDPTQRPSFSYIKQTLEELIDLCTLQQFDLIIPR